MYTFEELVSRLRRLPRAIQRVFAMDIVAATVGIGCLAAGVFIRHSPEVGDFKDGLGALCDALVIAAILKLTVDPILKRELAKDAARDVFLYAFGYSLPGQLRSFVNDLVLETKIVRRQCHLHWQISPKAGDLKRLEVVLEASFFVTNYSGSDLPYQHKVYSWKEDTEDVGGVRAMYCEAIRHPKKSYRKEQPDELVQGDDGYIRGERVSLPAHTREDEYRMGAVYFAEAARPGLDQFNISEPTMEITVTVTVDDQLGNLAFSVIPDLSDTKESDNYVLPERSQSTKKLQCSWKLDRVFVTNERVLIRWKEKEFKPPTFAVLP
jgi:hypothetical protein